MIVNNTFTHKQEVRRAPWRAKSRSAGSCGNPDRPMQRSSFRPPAPPSELFSCQRATERQSLIRPDTKQIANKIRFLSPTGKDARRPSIASPFGKELERGTPWLKSREPLRREVGPGSRRRDEAVPARRDATFTTGCQEPKRKRRASSPAKRNATVLHLVPSLCPSLFPPVPTLRAFVPRCLRACIQSIIHC